MALVGVLSMIVIMSIPSTGLQTIFAQQAAAALDEKQQRQLRGTVRTATALPTSDGYNRTLRATDPATSAQWSIAGVNNMEAGIEVG